MITPDHVANRNAVPPEELAKYDGQHIAWSLDGRQILDGDKDPLRLIDRLQGAGYKSDEFVLSFVDGKTYIGGVALTDDVVDGVPIPDGGFADPVRWEAPEVEEGVVLVDREGLTEEQIRSDIASRGRERTADEYGIPRSWLACVTSDEELSRMVLGMHGKPWPNAATEAKKATLSPISPPSKRQ